MESRRRKEEVECWQLHQRFEHRDTHARQKNEEAECRRLHRLFVEREAAREHELMMRARRSESVADSMLKALEDMFGSDK
jgi:hypothetical protein